MQRLLPQLAVLCAATGCAAPRGSIGAVLAQAKADGRVTIREAPAGLPAADAGIGPDDELLLIDGRDVRSMSPQGIHEALEGEVGSTVRLTILSRGRIERISLRRAPFVRSVQR